MRCFFSITLESIKDSLNKLEIPTNKSLIRTKDYHLTLVFPEELSEESLKELLIKLGSFKFKQFSLVANEVLAFPNKDYPEFYALKLNNSKPLNDLRDELAKLMNVSNRKNFSAHITLARKEKPNFQDINELFKKIDSIHFNVRDFGLYKSEPEKGMNSYIALKIVKLV